ncbi:hypothetical protein ON010_g18266 [Phytophthora cinnamomi]|nr:hypothetical protein ON010_g18266 [Phytophthora cinnamomi]
MTLAFSSVALIDQYCAQVKVTIEIHFGAKTLTSHLKHGVHVSFAAACTSPTAIEPSLSPHAASFVAFIHSHVAVRDLQLHLTSEPVHHHRLLMDPGRLGYHGGQCSLGSAGNVVGRLDLKVSSA